MIDDPIENSTPAPGEQEEPQDDAQTPIGIARIREEWRAAGLSEKAPPQDSSHGAPVVFDPLEGGAGIGDYVLESNTVRDSLGLSQEAMDRLVDSGELDSILLRGPDGHPHRMISEASVKRFEEDSAIDPGAIERAAKAMADKTLVEAVEEVRSEVNELRSTQGKVLQQMKDMLLLEVRNLKEQDRDLTSFVYELAEEIRRALGKKK